jgi:hypothetical protein
MDRRVVVMKLICSFGHCECDGQTVHKLSQQHLTADWLAPRESDCSRMYGKVSSDWLPSYIKVTRPVLQIFKMAVYFPDGPRKLLAKGDVTPQQNHSTLFTNPHVSSTEFHLIIMFTALTVRASYNVNESPESTWPNSRHFGHVQFTNAVEGRQLLCHACAAGSLKYRCSEYRCQKEGQPNATATTPTIHANHLHQQQTLPRNVLLEK